MNDEDTARFLVDVRGIAGRLTHYELCFLEANRDRAQFSAGQRGVVASMAMKYAKWMGNGWQEKTRGMKCWRRKMAKLFEENQEIALELEGHGIPIRFKVLQVLRDAIVLEGLACGQVGRKVTISGLSFRIKSGKDRLMVVKAVPEPGGLDLPDLRFLERPGIPEPLSIAPASVPRLESELTPESDSPKTSSTPAASPTSSTPSA